MCFGVPMRVIQAEGTNALCDGFGRQETVSTALLDHVQDGDFLLVYLGSAVRILDAAEARQIGDAIEAVEAAATGQPFDHLISDLINRNPELPPHLQQSRRNGEEKNEPSVNRGPTPA